MRVRVDLGAPRIGVWQLAWPAVLANLLQSTVGLIDIKAVGSLGAPAVAAATAGHRLLFVLQAMLMAAVAGTTAFVSRAWGAGNRDDASRVVVHSLVLAAVIAGSMAAVGVAIADPFSAFLGLRGDARQLAIVYTRWLSCFTVAYAVAFVLGAGLRATGDTRTPLLIGIVTNACNILLLYLFVYGGWHFPTLGIAGAALAGGLAFSAGSILLLWLWVRGRLAVGPIRVNPFDRERSRALLQVGYPAARRARAVHRAIGLHRLYLDHLALRQCSAGGLWYRRPDFVAFVRGRVRLRDRRLDPGRTTPRSR
jgi:putative MATE family efflux protein